MSLHDYNVSRALAALPGATFHALIMAAMRRADSGNIEILSTVYPEVWDELQRLYNTPGAMQDASEGEEEV